MNWIDLAPDLTKKGQRELKVGQVLLFNYEGSETHLKIMRKRNGKVWVKQVFMYKPEEVEVRDKVK